MMNLATGSRCSLNETFKILRGIIGYKGEPIYQETRTGDIRESLADISRARKLLGYAPTVDFGEGLRRTVEWYKTSPIGS
jgi:nucleoside-diphosphate-sugar epimerase